MPNVKVYVGVLRQASSIATFCKQVSIKCIAGGVCACLDKHMHGMPPSKLWGDAWASDQEMIMIMHLVLTKLHSVYIIMHLVLIKLQSVHT